uniref:Uncharacterized protein n=1 Tax=Siphoviridae sp. ctGa111 TaxID=2825413 RepID=A0A8S5VDB9_9CAUD|nr:MAG TPA: hypothetical protein [Siphoviridae sp. ctGa111]
MVNILLKTATSGISLLLSNGQLARIQRLVRLAPA